MKARLVRRAIHRIGFLLATLLLVPLTPIAIIYVGVSSPEYVIRGTLSLDVSSSDVPDAGEIYVRYLLNLVQGNLGRSTSSGLPVLDDLTSAIGESLKIMVPALGFSYLAGSLIGILALRNRFLSALWQFGRGLFYLPMVVTSYLVLYSIAYLNIDLSPQMRYAAGTFVLSIYPTYVVANSLLRTVRTVSGSEFFTTHLAMGFDPLQAWEKFCYKFVLIDFLGVMEGIVVFMFGFILFAETPFGIHGMGYKFLVAVQRFDYAEIIGFCGFGIIVLTFFSLLVDSAKSVVDPRIENV